MKDIALVHTESGTIQSFVGISERDENVEAYVERIQRTVFRHLRVVPVEAATLTVGAIVPGFTPEPLLASPQRRSRPTLRQLRLENSQCIKCGSPDLVNATHCAEHTIKT